MVIIIFFNLEISLEGTLCPDYNSLLGIPQRDCLSWSLHGFILQIYLFYCRCMHILPEWIYVYHMHAWCLQKSEGSIQSPSTGATDGCEQQCG